MITQSATRILPTVPMFLYVSTDAKQKVDSIKRQTVSATMVLKRRCFVLES